MTRNLFCIALLLVLPLVGCDSGGGDDFVPSNNTNLPAPIVGTTPVPTDTVQGVTATATFSQASPLTVNLGGGDSVITVTGSPTGGSLSLSNIVGGGTGGTFVLGPGALDFTFTTSSTTATGTATVSVTYTPPAPNLPVTITFTITVIDPVLFVSIVEGQNACGGCVDSMLYTIDPTTGAITLVGPMGDSVNGLAFGNGILYGSTATFESTGSTLLEINTATGASTAIGQIVDGGVDNTGVSPCGSINDLAFDSANGVMYAVGNNCDDYSEGPHLFSINLTTGAGTDLGEITGMLGVAGNFYGGNSLAYDAANDRLYLANYEQDTDNVALYELNRATAAVISTAVFDTTDYCGRPTGMGIDPSGSIFIVRDSAGCTTPPAVPLDFGSLTTGGVFTSINSDLTGDITDHVEAMVFGF